MDLGLERLGAARHRVRGGPASTGVGARDSRGAFDRAGGYHTLATTQAGTLATWGWNAMGQLGEGTTSDRLSPVMIGQQAGISNARAVAGGLLHSMALGDAGEAWTWGWNALGQFGDGTTLDRRRPITVPGVQGMLTMSGDLAHSALG